LLRKLRFATPEAFAGNPCTFRHGAELGPGYLRVTDPPQSAIGTRNHVLAADQLRIAYQALGDQLRVLDEVAEMSHHAGHQHLAIRELPLFPDSPLMFMTRVRGLDREHTDIHPQKHLDDVPERDVGCMRSEPATPAGMQTHTLRRDAFKGVIDRL